MLALDVGSAIESASNLLAAQVLGLDTNPYGGTGAFSQSETGAAGDLNIIILMCVPSRLIAHLLLLSLTDLPPPVSCHRVEQWCGLPNGAHARVLQGQHLCVQGGGGAAKGLAEGALALAARQILVQEHEDGTGLRQAASLGLL